jgi:putative peptide zinc metalloprotease protein
MAFDRPTFHEAWYRIADLRPRLLSTVRVYRQHFRGVLWHVIENPSNNQFSRVSEEAYRFIGMLDGKRTIAEVWDICNEKLGDSAMTQPEVVQLLGQVYSMNLLYVDMPPDSQVLFDRYTKRVRREVQSYLTNILFVRIPILDPDRFLERWVNVFGSVFSLPGLALWLAVIVTGLYFVIGNLGELIGSTSNILDPDNLAILYLTFVGIKIFHEFGHAFACKKFGRLNGSTGEVHKMGVMFLVFVPLPYLDASTAWAFRNKWHRALVGMSGVMVELSIAAAAAVVWANTSTGTLHAIAYNAIFVASVSTLLFNGNFLLRFDAYYVLSDLIEMPNLSQRSRDYLYYLVKRRFFGLSQASSPAHTSGERYWFVFYGLASTGYRVFISIRIMLFLNERLPEELSVVVPVLIFSGLIGWVFVPMGKFIRYLATGSELARNRPRALATTAAFMLGLVVGLGVLKMPDHCRVEGIVEPVQLSIIHAKTDGFITDALLSDVDVTPEGPSLIESYSPALTSQSRALVAERRALTVRRDQAMTDEVVAVQIFNEELVALDDKIARVNEQLAGLNLRSPIAGTWISSEIEHSMGRYVRRGEQLGIVADLNDMVVRATAGQNVAATLIEQADTLVAIRARKRPEVTISGTIEQIFPAGQQVLPSEALGYTVGGSMPLDMRDPSGTRTAEMFFEIRIRPHLDDAVYWRTGQRVVVRARLRSKPLAAQLWHYARQLLQQRFRI